MRNARIERLAAQQGGVITGEQAEGLGYSAEEIQRLRKSGDWWTPRWGIYAPAGEPSPEKDPFGRYRVLVAAAHLALDCPAAAVAHTSAGVLWELEWLHDPKLDTVWLACPAGVGGSVRHYPGLRLLPAGIPEWHVTRGPGPLRICTPARTVVDLARHLPFDEAVVLGDSAARKYAVSRPELEKVLQDMKGWPGTRRARRAVDFIDGRAESPAESLARVVLADLGFCDPELQIEIRDGRGLVGRVDLLFRRHWTVVEVDGRTKYGGDPDALWREKRREDRLRELGYEVVRLTWAELVGSPEVVRAKIAQAFARAEARHGR